LDHNSPFPNQSKLPSMDMNCPAWTFGSQFSISGKWRIVIPTLHQYQIKDLLERLLKLKNLRYMG
jgi:hypothetical protein